MKLVLLYLILHSSFANASIGIGLLPVSPIQTPAANCALWPHGRASLQELINDPNFTCIQIKAGNYFLDKMITVPSNKRILGSGRDLTILQASAAYRTNGLGTYYGTSDAMFYSPSGSTNIYIGHLTLNGNGIATYGAGYAGMTIENTLIKNTVCSAIGIQGYGMIIHNNKLVDNAKPTPDSNQPSGVMKCNTYNPGATSYGAAIAGIPENYNYGVYPYAPRITNNEIYGSYGPALDNAHVWDGVFAYNYVHDNTGWAALNLYASSRWTISNNIIVHPTGALIGEDNEETRRAHPHCFDGPAGFYPSAIFLCEDTDVNALLTGQNRIENNIAASFYGIQLIGPSREQGGKPYVIAPHQNQIINNNVYGSSVGCADALPGGHDYSNTWQLNNCGGSLNTLPVYFKTAATMSAEERINLYYQHAILRKADAAGLDYWVGQLNSGVPKEQVEFEFTKCLECHSALITQLYIQYLGRLPDSVGAAYYLSQLQVGSLTSDQLRHVIVNSPEGQAYLARRPRAY